MRDDRTSGSDSERYMRRRCREEDGERRTGGEAPARASRDAPSGPVRHRSEQVRDCLRSPDRFHRDHQPSVRAAQPTAFPRPTTRKQTSSSDRVRDGGGSEPMTSKAHSPYQTRRLSMICHRSHTCPCSLQWPECLVVLGLSGCWIPVNYSLRSAREHPISRLSHQG